MEKDDDGDEDTQSDVTLSDLSAVSDVEDMEGVPN